MKVSVLCFDLASNAAGRAFLLARLLEPLGEVEVVGPRYGEAVWEPMASERLPCRAVPGGKLSHFAASLPALLRLADGDLLYACKPRLTSAGIGYLKRLGTHRPLLLDIDDWEVGFFLRSGVLSAMGRALNLANPTGLPWTWLMERLRWIADGITVASRFLERRFGGTLIPHVRDTDSWTGRRDVALALVGTDPTSATGRALAAQYPGVRLMGRIPFDHVPRYLAAADVVVVPQRDTSDTRGQTPAKLFDAMALGRAIVSTRVSMIPEILDGCGVLVPPGDVAALAQAIGRLLDHPDEAAAFGRSARERCVTEYSFAAARRKLFPLVERVAGKR